MASRRACAIRTGAGAPLSSGAAEPDEQHTCNILSGPDRMFIYRPHRNVVRTGMYMYIVLCMYIVCRMCV